MWVNNTSDVEQSNKESVIKVTGIVWVCRNSGSILILEIVCAQHDVHRVQKMLVECVVREHKKIANLHHFKVKKMQNSVNCLDLGIRWINATFNNHGRSQLSGPLHDISTMSTSLPLKAPDADSKLYFALVVFESWCLSRHSYTIGCWN